MPSPTRQDEGHDPVRILEEQEDYQYKDLFRVIRARLQFRRFDGEMSAPVTRLNFWRGESVGVLLYDPKLDSVILTRQFRYPVFASLPADQRSGDRAWQAWLIEIVAGVQEKGQSAAEVADRELLEEAGYRIKGDLHPVATIYPSPGGTSERIAIFWAQVDHGDQAAQGGGVMAEGEDIQLLVMPLAEAMSMVAKGEICDGKTILALQHLALMKAGHVTAGS